VSAAYLDSSAIVKLYANEEHHQQVRALTGVLLTSALARVEVTAAFFGKARSGEITMEVAQILNSVFTIDWEEGRFLHIASDPKIENEAAELCARYLVRGFDAVHLSTANAARRAAPECTLFVCFDKKLSAAAIGERFQLLGTV
jgi:uncharacterized protein